MQYFKIVCLHDSPSFLLDEFRNSRVRFGWSPPGTDLREIRKKPGTSRSDDEKVTWRYSQFLTERIVPGSRIVMQLEQPIETFVIGEVTEAGYTFEPGNLDDFNHVLHVRPLTSEPIPVNSKEVSQALKHDLSKRGHYYEIYPESSIQELNSLVEKAASNDLNLFGTRTDADNQDRTRNAVKEVIARLISEHWPHSHLRELL